MSYSFRLRFNISDRVKLPFEESVVSIFNSEPIKINLHALKPDKSIKESSQLVLKGQGYESEQSASEAGIKSRDQLTIAFATLRFHADFGDRAPKGHWTEYGLKMLEQERGHRVLNDVHGLLVFQTDNNPKFVTTTTNFVLTKSLETTKECLEKAFSSPVSISEKKRLAFDLYSASAFTNYADARFMLLMMAMETLIEQQERNSDEQELINRLIKIVEDTNVISKNSLLGGLRTLKKESIGTAGRKLSSILTDKYMDMNPQQFFTHCYDLRSRLVHGNIPRPTFEEVGNVAASLETFTADLIVKT